MDKKKPFLWYFAFSMRESFSRLSRDFFSWKLLLLLIALGYEVLISFTAAGHEGTVYLQEPIFGMTIIWLLSFFPYRLGKMFFLLPMTKKDREQYMFAIFLKYILFAIGYFVVLYVIMMFAYKISPVEYFLLFLTKVFPMVLLMSAVATNCAVSKKSSLFFSTRGWYHPLKENLAEDVKTEILQMTAEKRKFSEAEEKEKKRQRQRVVFQICSIVFIMICFSFSVLLFPFLSLPYLVVTGVMYLISFFVILSFFEDTKNEINNMGVYPGKGEYGCSL